MSDSAKKGRDLAKLLSDIGTDTTPPVEKWNPDYCGDIDMRIASDGTWFYMGTPIGRPELVRLFSGVLKREGDKHYLVTPVEKIGITVDDAPFFVTAVEAFSEGADATLIFHTMTGDRVVCGADHPLRVDVDDETGEPRPYVHVRGGMDGLLSRPVFYELVELAQPRVPGGRTLGIYSDGVFFPIGEVPDDPA